MVIEKGGGSSGLRNRKKIQVIFSDWEVEQLQRMVEERGVTAADLVRDGIKSLIGLETAYPKDEDWDYIDEWDLLWKVRLEAERTMKFLSDVELASEGTDLWLAQKGKLLSKLISELNIKIAQARIQGRRNNSSEKSSASWLLHQIVEGRKPTDTEIIEVCQAEDLSKEKMFELRDRLFNRGAG